ncbi:hypothetical protein YPPY66_2730, partial [Yersinia pestis PY-66]
MSFRAIATGGEHGGETF